MRKEAKGAGWELPPKASRFVRSRPNLQKPDLGVAHPGTPAAELVHPERVNRPVPGGPRFPAGVPLTLLQLGCRPPSRDLAATLRTSRALL